MEINLLFHNHLNLPFTHLWCRLRVQGVQPFECVQNKSPLYIGVSKGRFGLVIGQNRNENRSVRFWMSKPFGFWFFGFQLLFSVRFLFGSVWFITENEMFRFRFSVFIRFSSVYIRKWNGLDFRLRFLVFHFRTSILGFRFLDFRVRTTKYFINPQEIKQFLNKS